LGITVAVLSGKGGTGKTSVCAGVSLALAAAGLRVLCIDCDVGLRNLDISLGLTDSSALSFLDISEGGYSLGQATRHPIFPTLSFLTAPMNRSVEKIDIEAFRDMLREARSLFDYIFLDAPAGVDAGFRLVSAAADKFILVTGSGPAAVRDAARVGELLELAGKTDVRLVVNRVDKTMLSILKTTIDDVMDSAGLPLLGVVLEDPDVPLSAACGQSLVTYNRRSSAAKSFQRIAKRIQGYPEPIKIR
jgi:septum site-determining protein MinD